VREQAASKAAIQEFARTETDGTARDWLTKKLGREPTEQEEQDAVSASMDIWFVRNVDRFWKK
jgi:hypothetical protein